MSRPSQLPTLALLMTGSELMSGDITDTNSAFISEQLLAYGIETKEKVTVGDELPLLAEQITRLTRTYDMLLINGGLGPTQDDLTAQVLASCAGLELVEHPAAKAHVLAWCEQRGFAANQANLKQALLPQGCEIFADAPGSAPAFYLTINGCLVIATPGVPSELKQILRRQILPYMQTHFSCQQASPWQRFLLFGIGESRLQQLLDEKLPAVKTVLDIGFRAAFPYVELKFKPQQGQPPAAISEARTALLQEVGDYWLGEQCTQMADSLVQALLSAGATVSCAESCTGGLIASEITRIAGASAVFPGSIVSYSNSMKEQLLGVPAELLAQHGAVSEATVTAMLKGLLQRTGTNYGIAVSGIAGPGGGSEEKPVGTVWIAWGNQTQQHSICLMIRFERRLFQELVATISMDLVRRQLRGATKPPAYLQRWLAQSPARL